MNTTFTINSFSVTDAIFTPSANTSYVWKSSKNTCSISSVDGVTTITTFSNDEVQSVHEVSNGYLYRCVGAMRYQIGEFNPTRQWFRWLSVYNHDTDSPYFPPCLALIPVMPCPDMVVEGEKWTVFVVPCEHVYEYFFQNSYGRSFRIWTVYPLWESNKSEFTTSVKSTFRSAVIVSTMGSIPYWFNAAMDLSEQVIDNIYNILDSHLYNRTTYYLVQGTNGYNYTYEFRGTDWTCKKIPVHYTMHDLIVLSPTLPDETVYVEDDSTVLYFPEAEAGIEVYSCGMLDVHCEISRHDALHLDGREPNFTLDQWEVKKGKEVIIELRCGEGEVYLRYNVKRDLVVYTAMDYLEEAFRYMLKHNI